MTSKSGVLPKFSIWATAVWLVVRQLDIQPASSVLFTLEITASWICMSLFSTVVYTLARRYSSNLTYLPGPKVPSFNHS